MKEWNCSTNSDCETERETVWKRDKHTLLLLRRLYPPERTNFLSMYSLHFSSSSPTFQQSPTGFRRQQRRRGRQRCERQSKIKGPETCSSLVRQSVVSTSQRPLKDGVRKTQKTKGQTKGQQTWCPREKSGNRRRSRRKCFVADFVNNSHDKECGFG